ncbi:sushi, von Willebrand factor type A, EGF and pentraxin domain-containing protein 1 [Nematostella vectensis]|uniref:sushi, von Willebrand factor type A, EGF and pentraxin domain-containing protein 1 n=1 Tax=Nematostella vectensis TaxID=45351 RepID=UPI0020774931|nr:sushi, von Willebrand factor type A, EGF and pentraxin domain-containing protein 1 [Nematostella vectensis]
MAQQLLTLVLAAVILFPLASGTFVTCKRTFTKVGCFKSSTKLLDQLLVNDRDASSGHLIVWKKWHESLHSLACRCAKKAREHNYTVFAFQNFGECWSGTGDYKVEGVSSECYLELARPPTCDRNDPRECMGDANVNYVYELDQTDPCKPNPCKNVGQCSAFTSGFVCTCTSGYTGKTCETVVDPCVPNPCKNGAICTSTASGVTCACPGGFTGHRCDQDVNECWINSPCLNGGTCINTYGSFTCQCRPGYLGNNCQTDTTACSSSPCANGGTCSNHAAGYTCTCAPGFTGTNCQSVCRIDVIDLAILMDGSGSVGNDDFINTKLFLLKFVDKLRVSAKGTHVGFIYYSDNPRLSFDFNDRNMYTPIGLKLRFLSIVFPDGDTRTDRALRLAGQKLFTQAAGDRQGIPNVLLLFTDGKTGAGSEPYDKVLKPLKALGVRTVAVGFGPSVDYNEMVKLAMGEKNNVITIRDIYNLDPERVARLIKNLC